MKLVNGDNLMIMVRAAIVYDLIIITPENKVMCLQTFTQPKAVDTGFEFLAKTPPGPDDMHAMLSVDVN